MPPKLVVQGVAIRAAHRPHLLPSGCWTARSGSSWHCWQGRHVGWCRGTPGYLIHPELDNIHNHIHIYLRSGGQDLSGRQPARLLREVEWPQSSPDCNSLDYLMWGGGAYTGTINRSPNNTFHEGGCHRQIRGHVVRGYDMHLLPLQVQDRVRHPGWVWFHRVNDLDN